MISEKAKLIVEQNDIARKCMGVLCRVVQTDGVLALPPGWLSKIRERVETFNNFDDANDPWHEHDMGAFVFNNTRIFWKIDYYDRTDMEHASEDPSDISKTVRVLTIMLASEY